MGYSLESAEQATNKTRERLAAWLAEPAISA